MARKHKICIRGFEAPRNSLELPAESFQCCHTAGDYLPYPYEVNQSMSKSRSFSANVSMKKLISDEISKGSNHKQQTPSIVARLMGMDVLPSDTESIYQPFAQDIAEIGDAQKQNREKVSNCHARKKSKSSRDKQLHLSHKHAYSHLLCNGTKPGKPRPRSHPQEKELQQFKKDFEAWQASRLLECARVVELGNIPEEWLAQLDLTKEKMDSYENAGKAALEKAENLASDVLKRKTFSGGDPSYRGSKKDSLPPKHKKPHGFKKKSMDRDFEELSMMDFDYGSDKSSTPARIVILKPGPENFSSNDESWVGSSGSVDDRDCIEDLLEEVKEKLKSELLGKTFKEGSMVRGGGIETPFKEKTLLPSQRARDLRKQVRQNITGDLGRKLLRSESTRSHRSEIHLNGDPPEFIRQDTRQLLSERLMNVLNRENHQNIPNIINCSSRPTVFDDTRGNLEQARNILNSRNGSNHWNVSSSANSCLEDFACAPAS